MNKEEMMGIVTKAQQRVTDKSMTTEEMLKICKEIAVATRATFKVQLKYIARLFFVTALLGISATAAIVFDAPGWVFGFNVAVALWYLSSLIICIKGYLDARKHLRSFVALIKKVELETQEAQDGE